MNERVKQLRKELGLTQIEFGEKIGLSGPAITRIEKGTNTLTKRTIKAIVDQFSVNRYWLETGDGDEMFLKGDGHTLALLDDLMMGENKTAKAVLTALANLTDDEWEVVDKLLDDVEKGRKG